jgi:hypothetical protein
MQTARLSRLRRGLAANKRILGIALARGQQFRDFLANLKTARRTRRVMAGQALRIILKRASQAFSPPQALPV